MSVDDQHVQTVDGVELLPLSPSRAGHAGELLVQPEVVLESDGSVGYALALDAHPLLRLHRLVQPVRPAAPVHQTPGELVHDDHFAVLDHVVMVPPVEEASA